MKGQPYERDYMVGSRRSRTLGLALIAAGVIALAAFGVWLSPGGNAGMELRTGRAGSETGDPAPVGTTGEGVPGAEQNSGPSASGLIRDLDTITGANDGHALVGRRVELRAPVSRHINDVAFWVGMGDNRLLVVLSRDDRDGVERQRGEPSNTSVNALKPGQQATISGSIQRVPYAEAMYSWGLTNADRSELMDRRIYLKADTISGP